MLARNGLILKVIAAIDGVVRFQGGMIIFGQFLTVVTSSHRHIVDGDDRQKSANSRH